MINQTFACDLKPGFEAYNLVVTGIKRPIAVALARF